jgi:HAD superfamily hydrolase (TIGR01490 family)
VRQAAVFDLDGTILNTSAERPFFLYLLGKGQVGAADLLAWTREFLRKAPALGCREAANTNKLYLRNKPCADICDLASKCFSDRLIARIRSDALAEIDRHRRERRYLVLLSGTLDIILEHFQRHLAMDCVIGSLLETDGGVFTGKLSGPHPFGKMKAVLLRQLADNHTIDLSESFGYGNSFTDVPFLSAVGHPVAVNPSRRLAGYAERHGWEIKRFIS